MTVIKVCLGSSCYVRGNNETLAFIKKMKKLLEEKYFKQVTIHYI